MILIYFEFNLIFQQISKFGKCDGDFYTTNMLFVLLKVEFFYFEDIVKDIIQKDINRFVKNKNIIDVKMTSVINNGKIFVQILVMYDYEETI